MSENYLHECLEAFPQVTKEKYGTTYDYAAIERDVAHLRDKRRPLTYDDLRYFESPRNWEFKTWWVFPPENHVTSELKGLPFDFWNLPKKERSLIESLIKVFKFIELVSIILRFVRPEHYGIISSPVERILEVRRGSNSADTYLNYIGDLRKIKEHYHFKRVADADMALWVLHERCLGKAPDGDTLIEYERDPFIREVQAKNLMERIVAESTYAQLARSLLTTNHELSGQLGGIAFEQMVWKRVPRNKNWGDKDLAAIIAELEKEKIIDPLTKVIWQRARRTRNKAIHMNPPPTLTEVKQLVELLDSSALKPAP